jgi:adenylate cyclase
MPRSPEEEWRSILDGSYFNARVMRYYRRFNALLPSPPRCRWCNTPFAGPTAPLARLLGHRRFERNPKWCLSCWTGIVKRIGGVEIEFSMLFCDVRNSTPLAERLGTAEFQKLMNRFYAIGADVLTDADGFVERFQGDQVVGYFFRGMTRGRDAERALGAAVALLTRIGYGSASGPWIEVGIGLNRDMAYFGTIGSEEGLIDLAAVGDAVNVAARLASSAASGEIIMSERSYAAAGAQDGEPRRLELKGKAEPVAVRVLRVG